MTLLHPPKLRVGGHVIFARNRMAFVFGSRIAIGGARSR